MGSQKTILTLIGLNVATRINSVFVDFENVQPPDIELLKEGPFKAKVFLGP
jgi:hypothetical protein